MDANLVGMVRAASPLPLPPSVPGRGRPTPVAWPVRAAPPEFVIQGLTPDGKVFRPSDWAERLAGAMSCFRPGGGSGRLSDYIGYSPYCVPRSIDGVKCVIVNEALRELEPMAWDFVMNFARDNQLQLAQAGPPPGGPTPAA